MSAPSCVPPFARASLALDTRSSADGARPRAPAQAFNLGALLLAAATGCAPEAQPLEVPVLVEQAHRLAEVQAWAKDECQQLGRVPLTSSGEEDGRLFVSAVCLELPAPSLGGRRPKR